MLRLNKGILKSYRAKERLTYRQAGKSLKVTGQSWYNWETGRSFPWHSIDALARLIGVPKAVLILEDGKKRK